MERTSANFSRDSVPASEELRVVVQQPALPLYRVPVFRELAARRGIHLTVVYGQSAGGPPSATADGFDARYAPLTVRAILGQPLYWHGAQWAWASRRCADVLVLSWDSRYVSLIPAILKARLAGVGVILWGHGYSKSEASWRRNVRDWIGRRADAVVLYNHRVARRLVTDGWARDRVFVALNSLDQEPIQKARKIWLQDRERLRAFTMQHDLNEGPVVLFVSRLLPDNGLDCLVEAVAALKRGRFPRLKLCVVGDGPDRSRIRQIATRIGIGDDLRMPGPIYDEEQLAPWFMAADVFCYPKNVGLSLQHAMGYGLPVVTSDNIDAQNPEIEALKDGVNGLLYKDGDPAALTERLASILGDAALRDAMSQKAIETVTRQFTLVNMVDGLERAIRFCSDSDNARKRETAESR